MTVKACSTLFLALAYASTVLAQTSVVRRLPARTAHQAPATVQTNDMPSEVRQLPVRSSSLSRSSFASAQSTSRYIVPTAKSEDLVESPATNVVKSAFGYTLGAVWEGQIPEDAEPVVEKYGFRRTTVPEPPFGRLGEVTFDVEPITTIPPFDFVTLFVSTNEHRIAAIAARTSRTILAESYTETWEKIGEIARVVAGEFEIGSFAHSIVTNANATYSSYPNSPVIVGKLYREFLKDHPDDPDQGIFKKVVLQNILKHNFHLIAGSRYNATPLGRSETASPDYLQQIWQPLELAADYYPYAGDAVIHFYVRDVEDRTTHANLVSVAELKKKAEANRAGQAVLTEAEQAFKDSLYRLSFAEAVEKAKEDNPEALLRIALAYADGNDIQKNSKKAREYIEKACELKYGYAQYLYGLAEQGNFQPFSEWSRFCDRCRHFGLNTSISDIRSSRHVNFAKAVQLLEQAISNGVSFAQADLEYARGKLKAAEEEEARKKRNAELLKVMTGDESQKEEDARKKRNAVLLKVMTGDESQKKEEESKGKDESL